VCADQAKEVTVNLHQKGKNLICLRKKEQNAGPKGKLTKCLKSKRKKIIFQDKIWITSK
jgi:hypothetical protein